MSLHPPLDPGSDTDSATLAALRSGIRRPGVPFFYTLGLALVAVAMVLLPLLYLSLVGVAMVGLAWHTIHHFTWFSSEAGLGRFLVLKIFAYAALLAVGLIVVFFLLKPLFARRPAYAQPLALHPGAEPRLYAFIEAVCAAVGAPKPRRIDLDCHLNASAGFRRGYYSFLGGDLVLTLGLPLVASLTVEELAGVVAHEFGHFTQGLAMRLGYVIERVNRWFARVVFERDAWDETLASMSENPGDWRIGLVVWTAQAGVSLSRFFLRLLMSVGVALSGFLSRQMEFHADACSIRLAGSETFERTSQKLATLAAALQHTFKIVRENWNGSGRLPDNLPELIRRIHHDLPEEVVARIHNTLGLSTTRWFDTHPCPAERIRNARISAQPGVFTDPRPAAALFENFDIPARQVTELHYTDDLGLPVTSEALLPLAPAEPPSEDPGKVSSPRSYRELSAPPIQESLLLDAPELLLPLPLEPQILNVFEPKPDAPAVEPTALKAVVDQLNAIRPQLADLATQARHLRPFPTRPSAEGTRFVSTNGCQPDTLAALEALRHAVREVRHASAHRLHLGLRLAAPILEPHQATHLQRLLVWLHAAQDEFDTWMTLAGDLSRFASEIDQSTPGIPEQPDPSPSFETRLAAFRAQRAGLHSVPLLELPAERRAKKLRVGPHAVFLREIEELAHEATAWLTAYHISLSELWAVAGREEARLLS